MSVPQHAETALSRALMRWRLNRARPLGETDHAWLYQVRHEDGGAFLLKLLKPEHAADQLRSARALGFFAGDAAMALHAHTDNAILLEWVEGVPLGSLVAAGNDDEATGILAAVAARLHGRPEPFPDGLRPLREHFASLIDGRPAGFPRAARDLFTRAAGLVRKLLETPAPSRPLHGNLGHDTIVSSPRGWLAVEPRGLLGDPHYDFAAMFLGPRGFEDEATSAEIIARRVEIIAVASRLDGKRLLAYAATHAALAACWEIEAGQPVAHQVVTLQRIFQVYDGH